MDRVDRPVGRVAQRDDADVEAARLERPDFLRNEGFGETRIALEEEGDGHAGQALRPPTATRASPGRSMSWRVSRSTVESPSRSPGMATCDGRG